MGALEPDMKDKYTRRNLWKAVIQRNLQNITKDLLVADTEKTYTVDPKELMKVLNRRMQATTSM